MTPLAIAITEMNARKDEHLKKIKEIDRCIETIQTDCDHKYTWVANTHNDDILDCIYCLHRIKI
jgi:hypothetical protein